MIFLATDLAVYAKSSSSSASFWNICSTAMYLPVQVDLSCTFNYKLFCNWRLQSIRQSASREWVWCYVSVFFTEKLWQLTVGWRSVGCSFGYVRKEHCSNLKTTLEGKRHLKIPILLGSHVNCGKMSRDQGIELVLNWGSHQPVLHYVQWGLSPQKMRILFL